MGHPKCQRLTWGTRLLALSPWVNWKIVGIVGNLWAVVFQNLWREKNLDIDAREKPQSEPREHDCAEPEIPWADAQD